MRTMVCFSRAIPVAFGLVAFLCAHPAFSQCTPINSGPLPAGPVAYIPNHDNNSVSIIQLAVPGFPCSTLAPTVVAKNRQGAGPIAVAASPFGGAVYVANFTNAASTTDPFAVVSPILFGAGGAIPVGSGQIGIALNPVLPFVYTVDQGGEFYHMTAIATNLLNPGTPPPAAALTTLATDIAPSSVAVTSDGATAWVTHSGANRVLVLALPGGATLSSIDVANRTCGVMILPAAAAAASIPPAVYVTVPAANKVLVIDPATYTVVGSIPVGNNPCDITANAAGTVAWVANYGGSTVSVIDTATGVVTGSLAVGFNPLSVKYDAATGDLVVLNVSGTVSIFSAASGALLGQVTNPSFNVASTGLSSPGSFKANAVSGSGAGIGMDTGRGGDGGGEPVLYYSRLDGSLASFGLYTSAKKTSIPASDFQFPAPTEREFAYDPINQIFWYSTYDGTNSQIRAVDPKTGAQWPVVISNLGCVDEAKASNCTNHDNQWDRHVFIDIAGKRVMTPNADKSVSLFDLKTGALAATIPATFFPDAPPQDPYLRHFASDARTGNVWYGATDGSFREMTTVPKIAFTGRVIAATDQIGGKQTNRRHFVVDSRRNQLIYETLGSPVGLASIDLNTLKGGDYMLESGVFQGQATEEPYLTISMVNANQCQLNLTVQPQGSGQVVTSPASNSAGYYDCNAAVTVTALPNANFQFGSFSGDVAGGSATQTVTLTTDKNVTATFAAGPPVTVNVSVSATSTTLGPGQSIQLKASVGNSWKKTVTWSVSSGQGAVDPNGVYTAPSQISGPQDVVVKATSNLDITKFGLMTLHLQSAAGPGAPAINLSGVVPVYSTISSIQPGSWISIYGTNLASGTFFWNGDFPASLGGVTVTIDGKPGYLWYVGPTQINLQAPDNTKTGPVDVVVTTPAGTVTSTVTLASSGPSFSLLDNKYLAGVIPTPNGSGAYGGTYDLLGPSGHFAYNTRAVKVGETVELFGVGFGPTTPPVPAGKIFGGSAPTTSPVTVTIGGVNARVDYAGITSAGLFQINVVVPGTASGDQAVQATLADGLKTPGGVYLTVQ